MCAILGAWQTAFAITVNCSLSTASIALGNSAIVYSMAGPAGQLTYHGIEGRLVGGTWQNWGIWNDSGGGQQYHGVAPATAGTYEVHCYAARADGVSTVSSSAYLIVNASAPISVNCSLSKHSAPFWRTRKGFSDLDPT